MEEPSLAPAWLSFNKELPASSQDKSPKPHIDRDKPKRFGKQNSGFHLTHSSSSYSSSASSNWRNSDLNPRVLNRSKSSPVFDLPLKANPEVPKSPDRSSNNAPSERHFPVRTSPLKHKLNKTKPPLLSSRSQPNLFTMDKMSGWQHQKITSTRSPPSSRSSSFSAPAPPPTSALAVSAVSAAVSPSLASATPSAQTDDVDPEMEKLRSLVPAPSVTPLPKPPSRLASNRKSAHVKMPDKAKKPTLPLAAQLKKASSESSLIHAPVVLDDLRRMKALKMEKVKNLKETVEDKDKAITTRNNFFMDVIKLEKQQVQDSSEEELENAAIEGHDVDEAKSEADARASSEDESYPDPAESESQRLSPNVEDEERFLRTLGWVPDEEDHVPELDDSEIEEVRLKLGSQQGSTPGSPLRNIYTVGVGLRSLEMRT